MKKHVLLVLINSFFVFPSFAQSIQNVGFETRRDTAQALPQHWDIKGVQLYKVSVDAQTKHSGGTSLQLSCDAPNESYQPFSQSVSINISKPTRFVFNTFAKKQSVQSVKLWCRLVNGRGKVIGFYDTDISQVGTQDWTNFALTVIADSSVKKLVLGGYLQGTGTVWFDDMNFQAMPQSKGRANNKALEYVQKVTEIIRTNSIVRDSIEWRSMETNLRQLTNGCKNARDTYPIVEYLIAQLSKHGDNHSFMQSPEEMAKMGFSSNSKSVAVKKDYLKPTGKYLGNGIGYVSVPKFVSGDESVMKNFANDIETLIRKIDTNAVCNWIIDFRNNQGGNMWPMIVGLRAIVGDEKFGYFVSTDGKKKDVWRHPGWAPVPYRLKNPNPPVAVLFNQNTASSGEFSAMSLLGRANTKSFGQPTAGYTTANQTFVLPDGAGLFLAVSLGADRTGKVHFPRISPDELITENDKASEDLTLTAAKKWLESKPSCR